MLLTTMNAPPASLSKTLAAEGLGTALLLAVVVGSGVMAERLAGGNVALALLANALATGAGLFALIHAFGPVSGAHFNPVVTLAAAWARELPSREIAPRLAAQLAGAVAGVILAHVMFGHALVTAGTHVRAGLGQVVSEVVATFGLVVVVTACGRRRPEAGPAAVAAYVTAAYWFTASTAFANPAVTVARALTDTFAGIRPGDVPEFLAAQVVGAGLGAALMRWLVPARSHVPMTPEDPT